MNLQNSKITSNSHNNISALDKSKGDSSIQQWNQWTAKIGKNPQQTLAVNYHSLTYKSINNDTVFFIYSTEIDYIANNSLIKANLSLSSNEIIVKAYASNDQQLVYVLVKNSKTGYKLYKTILDQWFEKTITFSKLTFINADLTLNDGIFSTYKNLYITGTGYLYLFTNKLSPGGVYAVGKLYIFHVDNNVIQLATYRTDFNITWDHSRLSFLTYKPDHFTPYIVITLFKYDDASNEITVMCYQWFANYPQIQNYKPQVLNHEISIVNSRYPADLVLSGAILNNWDVKTGQIRNEMPDQTYNFPCLQYTLGFYINTNFKTADDPIAYSNQYVLAILSGDDNQIITNIKDAYNLFSTYTSSRNYTSVPLNMSYFKSAYFFAQYNDQVGDDIWAKFDVYDSFGVRYKSVFMAKSSADKADHAIKSTTTFNTFSQFFKVPARVSKNYPFLANNQIYLENNNGNYALYELNNNIQSYIPFWQVINFKDYQYNGNKIDTVRIGAVTDLNIYLVLNFKNMINSILWKIPAISAYNTIGNDLSVSPEISGPAIITSVEQQKVDTSGDSNYFIDISYFGTSNMVYYRDNFYNFDNDDTMLLNLKKNKTTKVDADHDAWHSWNQWQMLDYLFQGKISINSYFSNLHFRITNLNQVNLGYLNVKLSNYRFEDINLNLLYKLMLYTSLLNDANQSAMLDQDVTLGFVIVILNQQVYSRLPSYNWTPNSEVMPQINDIKFRIDKYIKQIADNLLQSRINEAMAFNHIDSITKLKSLLKKTGHTMPTNKAELDNYYDNKAFSVVLTDIVKQNNEQSRNQLIIGVCVGVGVPLLGLIIFKVILNYRFNKKN